MELIPYEQFGRLRLTQFTPSDVEVIEDYGYEWMGGLWINESIGFTSMSRHEETPDETGGLEVNFSELPDSAASAIFEAIHLPLRRGMTLREICSVLGEPEHTDMFVDDRKSYDCTVGSRHPYYVLATAHNTDGLIYVAVIRKDVLSKFDA